MDCQTERIALLLCNNKCWNSLSANDVITSYAVETKPEEEGN